MKNILISSFVAVGLFAGCGGDDDNNGANTNNETNNSTNNETNNSTNNETNNETNNATNNSTNNETNNTTGNNGETAQLQVIHNAADPAAAIVDIYVNDELVVDDFAFRTAAGYIDVPAGADLNVVAPGDSATSADAIATFGPYNLAAGSATVLVASGVLDPSAFTANPDGNETAFNLYPIGDAELTGAGNNRFVVFHGATDAPAVDVVAGGAALVDGASYGANSGYIDIPNGIVAFDVNADASDARLISYQTPDVSDLGAVVVASGFLDATQNADAAFGLFAYTPDGGAAIPLEQAARLQVIHNSADPAAAVVDIYLNGALALDDFAFRTATPFITAPSGVEIGVGVAGGDSAGEGDIIATIPVTLAAGSTNQAIANGVLDPTMFQVNPDGASTGFELFVATDAVERAEDPTLVAFRVVHGATDAPTVDVTLAFGGATLFDDASYGDITEIRSVVPLDYSIDLQLGDNSAIVATYNADLSALEGGAGIILASGFLSPADDQNGEALELIFFTAAGGAGVALPVIE